VLPGRSRYFTMASAAQGAKTPPAGKRKADGSAVPWIHVMAGESAGDLKFVEIRDEPLKGAMMIVGFPTHGLVGSVAASYLVHTLDMGAFAYAISESFPPTVIMEEGIVNAPVRIYASKVVCGPDRRCDQLVVALSDIQPSPEVLNRLSRGLLDWAESKGINLVIAVEGQPMDDEVTTIDARVVAMTNRAAASLLEKYHFERANGVVTGFSGGLMLWAIGRALPVVCLVAQAHKDYPDARAAAKIIETINPLVPMLVLDTKPLRDKARQIEAEVRKSLAQQRQSLSNMRQAETEGPGEMYR
jgi:uncharacterized protein